MNELEDIETIKATQDGGNLPRALEDAIKPDEEA